MSFAFLSSIDLCSPLLIWRIHTLSCCWHSRRFCRAGRRTFLLCSRDAFALRQSHDGSTHLPSCLACHNSSWLSSLSPSCITLFPNRATTSASRIGVTTLWMLIYASYLLIFLFGRIWGMGTEAPLFQSQVRNCIPHWKISGLIITRWIAVTCHELTFEPLKWNECIGRTCSVYTNSW